MKHVREVSLNLTPQESVLYGLTGPTNILKTRHSPVQTQLLRGRSFKDGQCRVIVLNFVAKHDSLPLLKNPTLKSVGESRGEPETAGSNGSPHFYRISPSFSGKGTLTTYRVLCDRQCDQLRPVWQFPRHSAQSPMSQATSPNRIDQDSWSPRVHLRFHFYYKNDSFIHLLTHSFLYSLRENLL